MIPTFGELVILYDGYLYRNISEWGIKFSIPNERVSLGESKKYKN